jgi:hypothetical protein
MEQLKHPIFVVGTTNLGDFLNGLPVLSGLQKTYGKFDLLIRSEMAKFKGIIEFLEYQDIFKSVSFTELNDDIICYIMASWHPKFQIKNYRNNLNRPTETCLYENFMKQWNYLEFEVDDNFVVKTPNYDIEIKDTYYVGDRWVGPGLDDRRESHILSHLKDFQFIDFDRPLLENAYIIKNLKKPFITNFTGVGMLADLLNVPLYCVWKPEDWKPEFRKGDDVSWDNGKNIQQVFEKHFYLDRKGKLVHANELHNLL